MSALLWTVLLLGAGILTLGAALMVLPWVVEIRATTQTIPHWRARLRLFGGAAPPIELTGRRSDRREPHRGSSQRDTVVRAGGRSSSLVRALPRLVGRLVSVIRIDRLEIDADLGLPDPADTGTLYGMLTPILWQPRDPGRWDITLRPDFTGARCAGTLSGWLRLRPVALVPPLVAFAAAIWRDRG